MGQQSPSVYQQVIEKTKNLTFRTHMLINNIEKRDAQIAAKAQAGQNGAITQGGSSSSGGGYYSGYKGSRRTGGGSSGSGSGSKQQKQQHAQQ